MDLICIADTHNKHEELILPKGDILIHAGDCSLDGTRKEILDFLNWFSLQPHKHKIFIAGNHDFYLERSGEKELEEIIPGNIHYLNQSGIKLEGHRFWGSPLIPGSSHWAFSRYRGKQIKEDWEKIPKNTDVLITHTPPYGILDRLLDKTHVGCEELIKRLKIIKPRLHIFGHIHEDYGSTKIGNTIFANTCCLDKNYRNLHPPMIQKL